MKIFECKCGCKDIFIKDSGNNKGLYCADCGKWMQWLGKDDLRLAERQIEQSIINPIPRDLDELKERDNQIRAEVIAEISREIRLLYGNEYEKQIRAEAIDELVKLVCEYYTMQERVGYYADTNNMIKQRIADFAEQLKEQK